MFSLYCKYFTNKIIHKKMEYIGRDLHLVLLKALAHLLCCIISQGWHDVHTVARYLSVSKITLLRIRLNMTSISWNSRIVGNNLNQYLWIKKLLVILPKIECSSYNLEEPGSCTKYAQLKIFMTVFELNKWEFYHFAGSTSIVAAGVSPSNFTAWT